MGSAELGKLRHVINRLALLGFLDLGIGIEGRQNIQTVLVKALIAHKGLTQLTRADKHRVGGVVVAQELLDVIDQSLPLVADLGTAAVGDHGQILAHLHLAHVQGVGQRRGGNIGRRSLGHVLQICQISGQSLEHCLGNFLLLHNDLSIPIGSHCYRYIFISIIPYRFPESQAQLVWRRNSFRSRRRIRFSSREI